LLTSSLSCVDYGSSFPDVVQGLEHVLESFCSNNSSSPSNFKHRDNLEKQVCVADAYMDFTCSRTCFARLLKFWLFVQLTFTALHLLGFVSPKDDQSLQDFLIKVRDSCLCICFTSSSVLLLFSSKYQSGQTVRLIFLGRVRQSASFPLLQTSP
jgi:hypothetical protein